MSSAPNPEAMEVFPVATSLNAFEVFVQRAFTFRAFFWKYWSTDVITHGIHRSTHWRFSDGRIWEITCFVVIAEKICMTLSRTHDPVNARVSSFSSSNSRIWSRCRRRGLQLGSRKIQGFRSMMAGCLAPCFPVSVHARLRRCRVIPRLGCLVWQCWYSPFRCGSCTHLEKRRLIYLLRHGCAIYRRGCSMCYVSARTRDYLFKLHFPVKQCGEDPFKLACFHDNPNTVFLQRIFVPYYSRVSRDRHHRDSHIHYRRRHFRHLHWGSDMARRHRLSRKRSTGFLWSHRVLDHLCIQ